MTIAARADDPPLRLLALGDSLVAGYGLPADQGFTSQLEKALEAARKPGERDVRVINAGVSGDTATGGLERLDWALGEHPDVAIVELGANDMLRATDPKLTEEALDHILTKLEAAHVKILLTGMKAAENWDADYRRRFDAIFPDLAERHHVAFYPFFLEGALGPEYTQADGMHPNEAGDQRIVAGILPSVERLVGRTP